MTTQATLDGQVLVPVASPPRAERRPRPTAVIEFGVTPGTAVCCVCPWRYAGTIPLRRGPAWQHNRITDHSVISRVGEVGRFPFPAQVGTGNPYRNAATSAADR